MIGCVFSSTRGEQNGYTGHEDMGLGLLWFIGGSLVTLVTYGAASGGGKYVVAYGAIFVGGLHLVVGLFQYISHAAQSPVDRLLPLATLELKALLRTMIASAESDGPLNDDKIQLVKAVLQRITGKDEFTSFRIRDVSRAMEQDRTKTSQYLSKVQSDLSMDVKQLILRTSAAILTNSDEVAARAQTFLGNRPGTSPVRSAMCRRHRGSGPIRCSVYHAVSRKS